MFIDNFSIFHGLQQAGVESTQKLHGRLETDGPIWQTFFFAAVSDPTRNNQTGFAMLILANNHAFKTTILVSGRQRFSGQSRPVKSMGMRVEGYFLSAGVIARSGPRIIKNPIFLDDFRIEIEKVAPDADEMFT